MPVIHIYTAEGFLSTARKKLMIEKVTRAAVEAEGLPTTDRTYVLIHEVTDGGWGWQGEAITYDQFAHRLPADPEPTPVRAPE
jgi:4-oxalocrotonate tautomerase family enzyme